MKRLNSKADYAVGYGRPPRHTQFKKGQSGNPTGRRQYTQTGRAQLLMSQELFRSVPVREGDRVVRMPMIQAIIRGHLVAAIKGKGGAAKDVLAMLKMVDAEGPANDRQAWLSHEEALEALEALEAQYETPPKIIRTIVDPNQETDLSRLSESELTELEKLLTKAKKT
jgi:Family of unknown function (DUF5681)